MKQDAILAVFGPCPFGDKGPQSRVTEGIRIRSKIQNQTHVEPDWGVAIRRFAFACAQDPERAEGAQHFLLMFERFERAIIVGAKTATLDRRRAACLSAFDRMIQAIRLN